jgi:phosphatidylserine/phosphatidylglycerophosphate/cardiolipin synthase-like enzyme
MSGRARVRLSLVSTVLLCMWCSLISAHQDPCHRLHSCPSDHGTYVCGDKGRCDRCPDNQYCLARKPRPASVSPPAPARSSQVPSTATSPSSTTVCFTPGGNCTDQIIEALDEAKRSILIQAYSFTSAPMAKALLEAHTRGVRVEALLDKSQRHEKYSSADFLANQGVPTTIDASHAIAPNKVMIIDGETVITGSFNFAKAAQEKNAENVLIIRDKSVADQYMQNWQTHAQHSQPYVGRGVRQSWRYESRRVPRLTAGVGL